MYYGLYQKMKYSNPSERGVDICGLGEGSTVEYKPADLIAQLLVIKYKIPDLTRKLCTLPCTLKAACFFSLTVRCRLTRSFDGVGSRSKLVCCDVRHRRRLTCCKCGVPGGSAQFSCRRLSVPCGSPGFRHRSSALSLGACQLDGLTRPFVIRLYFLKQVQDMLCTISSPDRKQMVICICESSSATDRDESGVPFLG
jgi:hypothetical protein